MSDLNHPYDKAARFAAKQGGRSLLGLILPGLAKNVALIRWLDTRTQPNPQADDSTCDLIAELADPQKPHVLQAVDIEFQAYPKGNELTRGIVYMGRLYAELKHEDHPRLGYEVFVNFVFLTGPARPLKLATKLRGTQAQNRQTLIGFAMRDADAAALLAKIADDPRLYGLLFWVSLMKGADQADIIQEWRRVADLVCPERLRGDLKIVVLTFAELARRNDIWTACLKDWNVIESTLLKEWTNEAVAKTQTTAYREMVLDLLSTRFSGGLPQDLQDRIQAESDPNCLKEWHHKASGAKTLAKFRAETGL